MADPNEIPPPPPDPTLYFSQQGQAQRPQQLSTLDLLRKRMASELENEQAQRMSDLGNALLTSRNRSLFGALGEGFRAQDEGARARMDRLRQLAETERQERALESQEAARRDQATYQRDSLALRRLEVERAGRPQFQVVGEDRPTGYAVVMDPRNPGQTMILQGVTPLQVATLNARTEAQNQQTLARIVEAAVNREATNRSNMGRSFSDADRAAVRRQAEVEGRRILQLPPLPETETATTPAPSQTLQYGGPRIAPRQP